MSHRFVFGSGLVLILISVVMVLLTHAILPPQAEPALAGGWAVVTLDALPEHVIAGEPLTVRFMVRQHGVSVLEGLAPQISFAQPTSADPFEVAATEEQPGHYAAVLSFPEPGLWTWTINAFGPEQPMPALEVLPARTAEEQIAYGADLFVGKGCVVCHAHTSVSADTFATINMGPSLTSYTSDSAFLRNWLHDPSATKADTIMPNLGLNDVEIEALIAFLLAE